MPQLPYLTVKERLGPIQYGIILARRLMMLLREHQAAGASHLTNEFVNSHGLLDNLGSDNVDSSSGNLQKLNFTIQSLPKPLAMHGTLTITQAEFQQSTKLFSLKKYDGSGVGLDVSESTNFACFKFPETTLSTETIATQNYVTNVFNTNAGPTGAKGDQGDQVTARTYNITFGSTGIYNIDGENNASIYLIRGQKYILSIDAAGHPFHIQTSSGAYNSNIEYSSGITNAGIDNGIITFIVPYDAPDLLYYVCEYHSAMNGSIIIKNLTGDSLIGNKGDKGDQGVTGPEGDKIIYGNSAIWKAIMLSSSETIANDGTIALNAVNREKTEKGIIFSGSEFNFTDAEGHGVGSDYYLKAGNIYEFTISETNIVAPIGTVVTQRFNDTRTPNNASGVVYETINGPTTKIVIFAKTGNSFLPYYPTDNFPADEREELIVGSTKINKTKIQNIKVRDSGKSVSSSDGSIIFDAGEGNTWKITFKDFKFPSNDVDTNLLGQLSLKESNEALTWNSPSWEKVSVSWMIKTNGNYNNGGFNSSAWNLNGNVVPVSSLQAAYSPYNAESDPVVNISSRYIKFEYDNDIANRGHGDTGGSDGWNIQLKSTGESSGSGSTLNSGYFALNNIDYSTATSIKIHYNSFFPNGLNHKPLLDSLNTGDDILLRSISNLNDYASWRILTKTVNDANSFMNYTLQSVAEGVSQTVTTTAGSEQYYLAFTRRGENGDMGHTGPTGSQGPNGDKGDAGIQGSTGKEGPVGSVGNDGESTQFQYKFSTADIEDGNIGPHLIKFKETGVNVDQVQISYYPLPEFIGGLSAGHDIEDYLTYIGTSNGSVTRSILTIRSVDDPSHFFILGITGISKEHTDHIKYNVRFIDKTQNISFFDADEKLVISFARVGDIGATGPKGEPSTIVGPEGPQGPQGTQGPQGEIGNEGDITGNWRRYTFKKANEPESKYLSWDGETQIQNGKTITFTASNTDFEGVDVSFWLNDISNNNYGSVGYIGIIQIIKQGDPSKRITGLLTQTLSTSSPPENPTAGKYHEFTIIIIDYNDTAIDIPFSDSGDQIILSFTPNGKQGIRGPTGSLGIPGPKGDVGPQGEKGEAGAAGEDGEDGAVGAQGPQGEAGPAGPQGEAGAAGKDGEDGAAGAAGKDGEDGAAGAQGPTGPQGEAGAAGNDGEDGAAGAQGPQGEAGAAGAPGANGKDGEDGAAGPAGPTTQTAMQTAIENDSSNPFTVTGALRVTDDITAFYTSSDERLKTNIETIENSIGILKKIRGVRFNWNELAKSINNNVDLEKKELGVIAQELENEIPEVLKEGLSGYKAVRYEKITPLLIECIKKQQEQIEKLGNDIEELKTIVQNK